MQTPSEQRKHDALAVLKHDLDGPLHVFEGFLGELTDSVESLSSLSGPVDAATIRQLVDDDFQPCLECLLASVQRMRTAMDQMDHLIAKKTALDAAA